MPKELDLARGFPLLLLLVACDTGKHATDDSPVVGNDPPTTFAGSTGCDVAPRPAAAPGGYYVNGNTICSATGQVQLFHGVDRPSRPRINT
jgi:hypothetical protein